MCDCDCELTKQEKWQRIREETALQIGRDCMEMGIVPFLERLVGEANTDILFERHVEGR